MIAVPSLGSAGPTAGAPRKRVADAIAAELHAHSIRHAFGMPGGEVVTLVDALEQAGIGFVLTRHETSAAIAAAATSLSTGAPGLLVTTLGPGLANAVNGIADAAQERMPLLVISGRVDAPLAARYTHQILDHAALMRAAGAKGSLSFGAGDAPAVVARAVSLALAPPCGPVHLDLAPMLAAEPAFDECGRPLAPPRRLVPAPDPADPALAGLRRLLEQARRPLLIAGFEAVRSGAAAAVERLATRQGVPVLTTYKAKGVFDETHPLALGAAGLSHLADRILLPLVRGADLVLLAGYDPIEMRPGWLDPFGPDATVVECGAPTGDHGMHAARLSLPGPIAPLLAALADAVPAPRWTGGEPAQARTALARAFAPPAPWGPHAVVETLQETLPGDALLTVDSGAHRILVSQAWRARRPLSILQSAGWCTMGAALPLALGSGVAEPGRPLVAVVGDGGIEMTLGELATLRDRRIPAIVLVIQDASLALIDLKQRQAGLPSTGVALGRSDLAAVARAMGGAGARVRDADALKAALREALARDAFTLIACETEASAYVGCI